MSTNELKACPWCNAAPLVERFGEVSRVGCDNRHCECLPSVVLHENFGGLAEASRRWNTLPRTPIWRGLRW